VPCDEGISRDNSLEIQENNAKGCSWKGSFPESKLRNHKLYPSFRFAFTTLLTGIGVLICEWEKDDMGYGTVW